MLTTRSPAGKDRAFPHLQVQRQGREESDWSVQLSLPFHLQFQVITDPSRRRRRNGAGFPGQLGSYFRGRSRSDG